MTNLDGLPLEVKVGILKKLNDQDSLSFALTSRSMYTAFQVERQRMLTDVLLEKYKDELNRDLMRYKELHPDEDIDESRLLKQCVEKYLQKDVLAALHQNYKVRQQARRQINYDSLFSIGSLNPCSWDSSQSTSYNPFARIGFAGAGVLITLGLFLMAAHKKGDTVGVAVSAGLTSLGSLLVVIACLCTSRVRRGELSLQVLENGSALRQELLGNRSNPEADPREEEAAEETPLFRGP